MTQEPPITRERMGELLNEDLTREFQAILGYVLYSQTMKALLILKFPASRF